MVNRSGPGRLKTLRIRNTDSDLHDFCFLDEVQDIRVRVSLLHHLDSHGTAGGGGGGGDGARSQTTIPDQ
jgi:hypothetical protein